MGGKQHLFRFRMASSATKLRLAIAVAVALMGLVNGLSVLLPARPGLLALLSAFLASIAPFAPSFWPFVETGRSAALLLGFFLCFLALGLARGKQRAWRLTILLLPLSALAHLVKGLDWEETILALALWGIILASQPLFRVASDPWRAHQGVVLLVTGLALFVLYSLGGFLLLHPQFLTTGTPGEVIRALFGRALNLPTTQLLPLTRQASWFLDSIPWLSATVFLTGMVFLLRPVSVRWWTQYQKKRLLQVRQRVWELLSRYGEHTLAFFAMAPELLHYQPACGEGVVTYQLTGKVAVVLGDPACASENFEQVTREFLDVCALQDWQVAIFQAHPDHLATYQHLGLRAFKIGEEALLAPACFTLTGSALANVRTSCRRAERAGVKIRWYEGTLPHEEMEAIERLSRAWLEAKEGKQARELGFSLGRTDELAEASVRAEAVAALSPQANLPRLVTGVALDSGGKAVAFVTFTPMYGTWDTQGKRRGWGWALDLMRREPGAPPGVMELLLVRAIERFRACGAEVVSLGAVALADTRGEMSSAQRALARFLMEHTRLFEIHRSLLFFKQKFCPRWQSRYLVASSTLALPRIALALLRVHQS